MRLDRYLCELNIGSRSQVKALLKKGLIKVNGNVVKAADFKVDECQDEVTFQEKPLTYRRFTYYMLNKPAGMISATKDQLSKTVLELFKDVPAKNLFPAGRLDKDTQGLLLITNDGALAHRLLTPMGHVPKTYLVTLKLLFDSIQQKQLEAGIDIGEKRPCQPAQVQPVSDTCIKLTIYEGKFHQVKRMMHAVGNEVTALKRLRMGSLLLDETLAVGEYRELTEEEIKQLKSDNGEENDVDR